MPFKTLHTNYIEQHQYFTAVKEGYETPTGKIVDPYYTVLMPDCAVAMAVSIDNDVLLIEQYRHPIKQICIELPGGFINTGEPMEKAVVRELLEETGYTFSNFHYIGKSYSNPGVLSNTTHMYIALGGVKTNDKQLDDNEEIVILKKSVKEVKEMLLAGLFKQSLHEVCLHRAFAKYEQISFI